MSCKKCDGDMEKIYNEDDTPSGDEVCRECGEVHIGKRVKEVMGPEKDCTYFMYMDE